MDYPSGAIIIWPDSAGAVPAGWLLCDGANGTPDLRDRYARGADASTYPVGSTGGAATTAIPSHNHTYTAGYASLTGSAISAGGAGGAGRNIGHRHAISSITTGNASATNVSTTPNSFGIYYIMRQ